MKAIQVAFGLLAAVAATAGHSADKVYKWKDANGIVHFSDAPPPKGTEFDNVRIVNQSAAITQTEAAAAPAAADPNAANKPAQPDNSSAARCANAQKRVELLASSLQLQVQRDGKTVDMTPEERSAELNIARATVDSLCPKAQQ
ncbi:MAG TPA: DUF4124 domain-containing protein [Tahibacter sp.]|uniref:DUF4124 domain-containing protein n=1 Tax=Tahibacter sp. TaxID=2056211 RepID=UPI002BF6D510|nr:DUF4124 domain-containing protein [Tahibacter sp.]HSX60943.1 DUF4124 domain-containing protein [Tahibacter sp.]